MSFETDWLAMSNTSMDELLPPTVFASRRYYQTDADRAYQRGAQDGKCLRRKTASYNEAFLRDAYWAGYRSVIFGTFGKKS